MVPTAAQLEAIAGFDTSDSNVASMIAALNSYGAIFGLDRPHRLAHYLSQTSHESGGFKYDEEIASGRAYEGREDLGNVKPGDGVRFKGRGPIQITGRSNYRQFTTWCKKNIGPTAPDFEATPSAINTDPWEGLAPIWYWTTRNLNLLADENNVEQITKRINGGRNGLADRLERYTRAALVLLGYKATDVRTFQRDAKAAGLYAGAIDGDDGPKTRAALHLTLAQLSEAKLVTNVKPGPVVTVEEKTVEKEVAVVAPGANKRGWLWWPASGLGGLGLVQSFTDLPPMWKVGVGVGIVALLVILLFLGDLIIRRTKALIKEIES